MKLKHRIFKKKFLNFKNKWVRRTGVSLLAYLLVSFSYSLGYEMGKFAPSEQSVSQGQTVPPVSQVIPVDIEGVWRGVNKERAAIGLGTLALSQSLSNSAHDKCLHMQQHDYWDHDGAGRTWLSFVVKYHSNYKKAGENLAHGYRNSEAVIEGWMNSPTHKENMLDITFNQVGYAVCDYRGGKLVVQHLIRL